MSTRYDKYKTLLDNKNFIIKKSEFKKIIKKIIMTDFIIEN